MDAAICNFYGFLNPPFGPAARQAPFFRTDSRNALVRDVAGDIVAGRAVVGLRGDHGIGKSTLMADMASALRAQACLVVTLDGAAQDPQALQRAIAGAMAQSAADRGAAAMADRLVLLFDDAELIPATMFRTLWKLLRACGAGPHRLHLVLIGGPGLWAGLNPPDLADMRKSAISENQIPYLQQEEAADYLDRKLQFAGQPLARLMTRRAVADLVSQAHGLPARLDALAEQALAFGYEHGRRRITSRRLRQALSGAPGAALAYPAVPPLVMGAVALACLVGVAGLVTWQTGPDLIPAPREAPRGVPAARIAPPGALLQAPAAAKPPVQTLLAQAAKPAAAAPGRAGLVLLAGQGDTLRSMYDRVYRGVTPPQFENVAAANPAPVKSGTMVVFPAPPGGWITN
jgi:type II secretory pathway predicted ATPase ExeA